jgi:hypothetical protein
MYEYQVSAAEPSRPAIDSQERTEMSLAALKRRLTVGTELEMVAGPPPRRGTERPDPWPRRVAKVQTNAVAFEGDDYSRGELSWLWWPAASCVEVTAEGFTLRYPDAPDRPLVYRFVANEPEPIPDAQEWAAAIIQHHAEVAAIYAPEPTRDYSDGSIDGRGNREFSDALTRTIAATDTTLGQNARERMRAAGIPESEIPYPEPGAVLPVPDGLTRDDDGFYHPAAATRGRYAVTVGECTRYRQTAAQARDLADSLRAPGRLVEMRDTVTGYYCHGCTGRPYAVACSACGEDHPAVAPITPDSDGTYTELAAMPTPRLTLTAQPVPLVQASF